MIAPHKHNPAASLAFVHARLSFKMARQAYGNLTIGNQSSIGPSLATRGPDDRVPTIGGIQDNGSMYQKTRCMQEDIAKSMCRVWESDIVMPACGTLLFTGT